MLDPVYTGKAFFGMMQEVKRRRDSLGQRIIFLHTGGPPSRPDGCRSTKVTDRRAVLRRPLADSVPSLAPLASPQVKVGGEEGGIMHGVVIPATFNDRAAADQELGGLVDQIRAMPGFVAPATGSRRRTTKAPRWSCSRTSCPPRNSSTSSTECPMAP